MPIFHRFAEMIDKNTSFSANNTKCLSFTSKRIMPNNTDQLVEVYSVANPVQIVELTRQLAAAGIEHSIVNDKLQGAVGDIPFTKTDPQVWVKARDAEAAVAICRDFDQRLKDRASGTSVEEDATQFCYHCGETVDVDTQKCPACKNELT